MKAPPAIYLGFDASTQSMTAMAVEVDGPARSIVFASSFRYDDELPRYGTRHGVLPNDDPRVAEAPPLMWAEALDRMMARVAASGIDLNQIAAISGSAQQHGSVYLKKDVGSLFTKTVKRLPTSFFSRPAAAVWMDASTSDECREIASAVGGDAELAQRTGSRAFERFTGPQIRKFFKHDPAAYRETTRIHLVSSFMASLLTGADAPLDSGDASGMNLMDLRSRAWWPAALDATAPNLAGKLPPIVASSTVIGRLSPYWRERYGLPAAKVVVWSGDNPCSLIGTGLVAEGDLAISLGTSDTIFGVMREPRVDARGVGHVFGAPTGGYMGLTCFANGGLARQRVRDEYDLDWNAFTKALATTPAGNHGALMLPWFVPEITPPVSTPGAHRRHLEPADGPANVRAVVEAQMMAIARYSRWMGVTPRAIHATGGAAADREILGVMADVFGADVYHSRSTNSACLGAALRAFHADALASGAPIAWEEIVAGVAEPPAASRIAPDPKHAAVYRELMKAHAVFEREILTGPL